MSPEDRGFQLTFICLALLMMIGAAVAELVRP